MSTVISFGAWLRQRRKALGLTHAALADAVHCSVSALRKIEQDERRPSHQLAERLAAKLQIDTGERARFLEIARGERRVSLLAEVSAPELPPLPAQGTVAATVFDASMPSIAVLPFVNLSTDGANEHFADGLAEELLNVLAKIRGLRVASRTSAFSFKGKDVDIPTIAQKLNVSSVLEGSVRQSGQRVRITAQLVKVASDSHLWSQTYDRNLDDIFAVQDDIAQSVVRELRAALLGEAADEAASARIEQQVSAASRGRSINAKAYQLYLEGRFLVERGTPDDTLTGIGYCRQALELDPQFALAWAGLAGAYSNQAGNGWAPLAETFELSRAAAEQALRLEPDLAEAHSELGWVRMTYDWDWRGAQQSYGRAFELAPGDRSIVVGSSLLADNLGRNDDAVALARRAVALDPLSYIAHGNVALRCFNAGLLDEAVAAGEAALKLNPRAALIHWLFGTILVERGETDAALETFADEVMEPLRMQGRALAHHAAGRREAAQAALDELIAKCAGDSAFQIAEALAERGDIDDAFEWLERARVQRDPGVGQLQSGPLLRKLHGDARWRAFLVKMGFDEAGSRPDREDDGPQLSAD